LEKKLPVYIIKMETLNSEGHPDIARKDQMESQESIRQGNQRVSAHWLYPQCCFGGRAVRKILD
jgi:hypothetical protein